MSLMTYSSRSNGRLLVRVGLGSSRFWMMRKVLRVCEKIRELSCLCEIRNLAVT